MISIVRVGDTACPNNLKRDYLECLAAVATKASALRQAVTKLLNAGVHWKELVRWAVDAGHADRYSRQILAQILRDLGIRQRKSGAGRETPQEALAIRAYVENLYGPKAGPLLLAAYRAHKLSKATNTAAASNL